MSKVVAYRIKSNRCERWYQPIARFADGSGYSGARWHSWREAREAIRFHHKNGIFPSEVEEVEVQTCEACGQPLPD